MALLAFSGAARADAVDDTLAKFLDDKFPQTAAAIGELAAEAPRKRPPSWMRSATTAS